jgi:hypothetical protein
VGRHNWICVLDHIDVHCMLFGAITHLQGAVWGGGQHVTAARLWGGVYDGRGVLLGRMRKMNQAITVET